MPNKNTQINEEKMKYFEHLDYMRIKETLLPKYQTQQKKTPQFEQLPIGTSVDAFYLLDGNRYNIEIKNRDEERQKSPKRYDNFILKVQKMNNMLMYRNSVGGRLLLAYIYNNREIFLYDIDKLNISELNKNFCKIRKVQYTNVQEKNLTAEEIKDNYEYVECYFIPKDKVYRHYTIPHETAVKYYPDYSLYN